MATLRYGTSSGSGGNWWSQLRNAVTKAAQSVSSYASRNARPTQQRAQNLQRYYSPTQPGPRNTPQSAYPNVRDYNTTPSVAMVRAQEQKAAAAARARAQASTATNWRSSFNANYPEFPNPTQTTMPDTYSGQALRYSQQRYAQYGSEFRLLPDTYSGQGQRLSEQLTGTGGSQTGGSGSSGGSGSGGYGYGGWSPGWGGGGGGSYEPPKPEWWLQLVSWNINRPEGG